MDFVCAPAGIVDARWPKQGMKDMQAAGFSAVMLDASLGHPARLMEKGKPEPGMKAFLAAAKDSGCRLPLAMAPSLLPETKREDLADRIEALAKETLGECAATGCQKLVLRPLSAGIAREALWDENRAYFLHLAEAARAQGVQLLLMESQAEAVHDPDYIFAREKREYIPVETEKAIILTANESRRCLKRLGIEGEIIRTVSHSADSVSLILDDGSCFVGDLEPREYIEAYADNAQLAEDWKLILSRNAKIIHYAHAPERTVQRF
jgi:hypothetical protein